MNLQLQDVEVRYTGQARPAVDAVGFELAPGEIGALIGPSGCGKTSLLRAVAGLERLSAGSIHLHGQALSSAHQHVAPEKRRMGMVFQDYALFPHMSVAQNVAFGLQHLPAAERERRVQTALDRVGLAQAGARAPHELSGGQQQRVALARALAPEPQLLLLDEPFSNLDVDLRERLAYEVRDILKAAGATALFVTHDQMEAFAIADHVGVMNQGRLHQWDAPYQLYHRPATRFVADFIGKGVFVPARVVRDVNAQGQPRAAHLLTALGVLDALDDCPLPGAYANDECDLLLRADDVVHAPDSPLRAQVLRKAFRGADHLYTLALADGTQLLAQVPSHVDHALGDWMGIAPALRHAVTFARDA
ncbi:ABC transporter ATP-binding protein [Comamonas serinivorans]|uniref:ABC transporter ATP-binding protein n=1 Tax=Comamonas serinivorans TaxID=1082851 RepID=A0A1Y0ENW5_9BURK|nr:ABC transporter ATP-binding protein [Comamonas serinivorans]ARU05019.1 ABC transporter ATP-binding protein [Comamonas serinivorans]